MARIGPRLIEERLERARCAVEDDMPRALTCDDVIWAEECRRSALNELVRAVYYLNGRLLRRLKSVESEIEEFEARPRDCANRLRRIAAASAGDALPDLRTLLADVATLASGK